MIAKKIVKATLEPCKISVDGANLDVSVGASIGIAVFPEDGATAESLVKSADEAMYQAKQRKCGYAFAG